MMNVHSHFMNKKNYNKLPPFPRESTVNAHLYFVIPKVSASGPETNFVSSEIFEKISGPKNKKK